MLPFEICLAVIVWLNVIMHSSIPPGRMKLGAHVPPNEPTPVMLMVAEGFSIAYCCEFERRNTALVVNEFEPIVIALQVTYPWKLHWVGTVVDVKVKKA
jgi:hypothetical protein